VVFGSLFAFWLTRIIDQSYERRRLIEQLEATRSELAAAEREGGRLAERQRLARDIHDTLAQGFVSIVLQLQAAEAELPAGAAEARAHLERARRVEVLELVARGSSNADIAGALFISEATVKTHLLHAFAKLGVDDRTAAVVAALERGIIDLPRHRP
jgi:DNA-binding NarL/FixJ family response regulator